MQEPFDHMHGRMQLYVNSHVEKAIRSYKIRVRSEISYKKINFLVRKFSLIRNMQDSHKNVLPYKKYVRFL